jgi:hypothetical protein
MQVLANPHALAAVERGVAVRRPGAALLSWTQGCHPCRYLLRRRQQQQPHSAPQVPGMGARGPLGCHHGMKQGARRSMSSSSTGGGMVRVSRGARARHLPGQLEEL